VSQAEGVLITGVYGSGKNSVAAEIAYLLEQHGERFALLDLDYLARQDRGNGSLVTRRAGGLTPASSASMAIICARIGTRAGEPGRARARLAASSRLARASSPPVRSLNRDHARGCAVPGGTRTTVGHRSRSRTGAGGS
jgi:hypothetical protein